MLLSHTAMAQQRLAITIDDPATTPTPLLQPKERNQRILQTLAAHELQAALFVCGMRVTDSTGQALLQSWDQAGHLLGNHTWSHQYLHSKQVAVENYWADILRCDSMIRNFNNFIPLFRFPFLKEGDTAEKRDALRNRLAAQGYRNGAVSIDASDWYIDSEMRKALSNNTDIDLTPYKEYYLRHILNRAAYYHDLGIKTTGRTVTHTLLLHHNLLNALFLEDLIQALKANGWELVSASEAFKDPVYALQPEVLPCGESILYQLAKLDATLAPTLRYPAEDGPYEAEGLKRAIAEYALKKSNTSSVKN